MVNDDRELTLASLELLVRIELMKDLSNLKRDAWGIWITTVYCFLQGKGITLCNADWRVDGVIIFLTPSRPSSITYMYEWRNLITKRSQIWETHTRWLKLPVWTKSDTRDSFSALTGIRARPQRHAKIPAKVHLKLVPWMMFCIMREFFRSSGETEITCNCSSDWVSQAVDKTTVAQNTKAGSYLTESGECECACGSHTK